MILLLIFAVVLMIVFANMSLYVAGAFLCLLIVIFAAIVKRRRN